MFLMKQQVCHLFLIFSVFPCLKCCVSSQECTVLFFLVNLCNKSLTYDNICCLQSLLAKQPVTPARGAAVSHLTLLHIWNVEDDVTYFYTLLFYACECT